MELRAATRIAGVKSLRLLNGRQNVSSIGSDACMAVPIASVNEMPDNPVYMGYWGKRNMSRAAGLGVVFSALVLASAALSGPAGAAAARLVTVRLTGLDRAGLVVAVPQAELLKLDGFPTSYQGTAVKVSPGTYLIAAEVPTYSTGDTVTSQTLVFRKIDISKTGTIRLNGRNGKQLTVALTGVKAQDQDLAAGACLANTPGGSGQADQAAWGGDGVAVYAVPVRSPYVRFGYLSILRSAAGASYYLVGSAGGGIPSGLSYHQSAAGLAKMTMVLRGGVFGSSQMDWVSSRATARRSVAPGRMLRSSSLSPGSTTSRPAPGRQALRLTPRASTRSCIGTPTSTPPGGTWRAPATPTRSAAR